MDNYLTEQQVEELINFDSVEKDLMDLIEEEQKFSMDEYLNSNIDYWNDCTSRNERIAWDLEEPAFHAHSRTKAKVWSTAANPSC